jgi:type VI secretion system protein ImpE
MAILGQWGRALNQLAVLEEMAPTMAPMVQTYRIAIKCEELRAAVFHGERTPLFLGEPERWVALLLQSLQLLSQKKPDEAIQRRKEALELAPAVAGVMDGVAFQWMMDADMRLGPVLEAIVNGKYYWIPFANLLSIKISKPVDLRDLVWIPAHLTLANGGELVSLLPVRYPNSEKSTDSAIRLSRKTDWVGTQSDLMLGLGQRMFATDSNDYPILDTRTIELRPQPDPAP